MNRSIFPALKAGLSRLHREYWPARTDPKCALTERRFAERRRAGIDFRHRESRLLAATEAPGLGMYDFDCASGHSYCSAELKAIAGLPANAGDLSLQEIAQRVYPADRERVLRKIEAAFEPRGDGRFEDEHRLLRPDGTVRWIKVRGRTFFAGNGRERRILGASGLVVDITERKAAERMLREQSEELRLALREGNSGTFQWDAQTHEHRWCDEMLALYGLKREEFGGRDEDWLACLLPEDRAFAWAAVERALKLGEYATVFRIRRRDNGEIRWIAARGQVSFDAAGVPVRMVGINADITEHKRDEERLQASEAALRQLIATLPGMVWTTTPDGAVDFVSQQWLDYTGTTLESQLGAGFLAAIHPDDRDAVAKCWLDAVASRSAYHAEYRLRRHDGSYRWFKARGTPLLAPDGQVLRWLGIVGDIDDLKRTQDALLASQAELRAVHRIAKFGTWYWDLRTGDIRFSESVRDIYGGDGLPFSEARGTQLPIESWERLMAAAEAAIQTGEGYDLELELNHASSRLLWVHIKGEAVRNEAGAAIALRGSIQDISERKCAEARIRELNTDLERRVRARTAELEQANEALLQSNAELKHFAHATAHDLQTPLRSIAGFAQLLQREAQGRGDERVGQWTALVVDNTKRLQRLIEELLGYARLDADGLPFEMVDLHAVASKVIASLAALIEATGAEVTCGALPRLSADRTQIAQVLHNLVENGIKYNRSQPPRVAIGCECQGDAWVCSVADNGIGIDPRHHERVFEIFRRLHTYRQVPGSGIGLALCRRIVERHGGRIWVASQPGQGSTFYFSLPASREDNL